MRRIFHKRLGLIKNHKILSFLVLAVLAAAALTFAAPSWFRNNASKKVVVAGHPVAAPSIKKSEPTPKKAVANAGVKPSGGAVTDTRGSTSASTKSSQWVTSASGIVTVKSPTANSTLHDGDVVSGTAKVDQVNYRLKDNRVGQIAQGTLSVVDGKFSGVIHFAPQGTGGQLDIYTTNDQGVEFNEVQINVAF